MIPVRFGLISLSLVIVLAGCTPGQLSSDPSTGSDQGAPAAKKRVTAAAIGNIYTVSSLLNTGSTGANQPGVGEIANFLHSGLTDTDAAGIRVPRLAQDIISVENGLWRVLPDGRMETTWKLRPNTFWHDGQPFTSDDLIFGATVGQDREIDVGLNPGYAFIQTMRAPDPTTIVVEWHTPYILADEFFAGSQILPRHLLEQHYRDAKATFIQLPYFSSDWIGLGPYQLRHFELGSHLIVEANDRYVLGRPRIDEIEVRFIPDVTTAIANLLAGQVEMLIGRGISVELAGQINRQWTEGRVDIDVVSGGGPMHLTPQHLPHASPAVVNNVQFKRALMHAIDRQQMADELQEGLVGVAHSPLPPGDQTYADLESRVVRYEYDPRKAVSMIESLGYRRGGDGAFRDAAGERLAVQITSTELDIYVKTALSAQNFWKSIGVETEYVGIPRARTTDLEYRASYSGFTSTNSGYSFTSIRNFTTGELRTSANSFRGRNISGFATPQLDTLVERYYTTIPMGPRKEVLGEIIHILTDQLASIPMIGQGTGLTIPRRLINVTAAGSTRDAFAWDAR